MSKYTTEVRFICEQLAGEDESKGYHVINEVIAKAIPKIFDFDFPIFDEAYRNVLCTKILKHYYTREIGEESVGLWKLRLDTKLNEIMPYYNQLYRSELLEFNPLYDVDTTTTNNGNRSENSNTTGTTNINTSSTTEVDGTVTGHDLYSDTPQGALDGVEDGEYLTNARKTTDETDSTTTVGGTSNTTSGNTFSGSTIDQYILKVQGKSAGMSYSKMLIEFRDTFLNIDALIIDDLSDLFFGLW